MPRLIPGWNQVFRKKSGRRAKSGRARLDGRSRRAAFETLETRWLLSANYDTISQNLQGTIGALQSSITAALNAAKTGPTSHIPVVGDKLGQAADFVSRFSSQLTQAVNSLKLIANPTDADIQNALKNVPFLADRNGNGVGADDVLITHPSDFGPGATEIEMTLLASATPIGQTFKFDTGLPSLPIEFSTSGGIDVSTGFAFELAFKFNDNNQVALDTTKNLPVNTQGDSNHPIVDGNNPLAIFVTAGLSSNFNATARIGFVQGTATPIAGKPNVLYVTALLNNLTSTPTVKIDGGAVANLHLAGSFAGTGNDFPGISTNFHLGWQLSSSGGASEPTVSFDDVSMDLGKFVSNVVGPVFRKIQEITAPIKPINDIYQYPLPGLTDLSHLVGGGKIDLLTLGGPVATALGVGPLYDLAHTILNYVDTIDHFQIESTVQIPLGGFDLNETDLRAAEIAGSIANLDLANLTNLNISASELHHLASSFVDTVNGLDVPPEIKGVIQGLTRGLDNGLSVDFPAFDHPEKAVFNLLLGKETDLFSMTADAHFDAEGSFATGLSIFGMGVDFGGEIHVDTHMKFAYDTFGLRELMDNLARGDTSHVASDIIDGFYLTPDSYFTIRGGVFAGVGASAGIFSATVGGFVSTGNSGDDPVSVTFHDPNNDGKLRVAEIEAHPFGQADAAIVASGKFTAELGLEVKAGVKVLGHFYGWKKRFDVAGKVLINFDPAIPDDPSDGPTLASDPDQFGNIQLYVGAQAGSRSFFLDHTDGGEKIIIKHIDGDANGETIEISYLDRTPLGRNVWVSETITGVKSITGAGHAGDLDIEVGPDVISAVHLEGGAGKATLTYLGKGTAYLKAGDQDSELVGGSGSNTLVGAAGSDTIQLGSGANTITGGGGANTIVIITPLTQGGSIVGGDAPGNTVVVVSGPGTQSISATPGGAGLINLNYQVQNAAPPQLVLSQFSRFVASAQDFSTNISIGDLSGAGVTEIIVNEPTIGVTGRTVDLDPRAGLGPSVLSLQPFDFTGPDRQHPGQTTTDHSGMVLQNTTTGVTTYLFGVSGDDVTTIHQHGGTLTIGQLAHDDGTIVFDGALRQALQSDLITMTTPVIDLGNIITTGANALNDFVVNAINYPTFLFRGMSPLDSIVMNLAAPGTADGVNQVLIVASTLVGALVINAQGGSNSKNKVTLSKLNSLGRVTFQGATSSSDFNFGTGPLADIQGNVDIHNATLNVDNSLAQGTAPSSTAPGGSILTFTGSSLGGWIIPGFGGSNPTLSYTGLHGEMTVNAGASDQMALEATPGSISSAVFNNATGLRDTIYTANWTVPITANGNFSIFLGQRLHTDSSVERVKHLTGVSNISVALHYGSPAAESGSQLVLDGDLDAPGAQYLVNSASVLNQTVGLNVTFSGYRAIDTAYVYMPGATVVASLGSAINTFTFDGRARLSGTNPTSPNSITASVRAGGIAMTPVGTYDTKIDVGCTVYVLGSLPQDSLSVTAPTTIKMASNAIGTNQTEFAYAFGSDPASRYVIQNPQSHYTVVWISPFGPFTGQVDRAILNTDWPGFKDYESLSYPQLIQPTPPFVYEPPKTYPEPVSPPIYVPQDLPQDMGDVFLENYLLLIGFHINYGFGIPDDTGLEFKMVLRVYPQNPNPIATDNIVNVDASQLRGSFAFQVSEPDYALAQQFADALARFDGAPVTNFGQTYVTISKTNPQLSTTITGTNPLNVNPSPASVNHYDTLVPFVGGNVSRWPGTQVLVGTGNLADIEGSVSVSQAWLKEVDNRNGLQPNILSLGANSMTWTSASGAHPTLGYSNLHGKFTVTGSLYDRFNVEGTPNSAYRTIIRNFSTAATPLDVYVTGKNVMPLEVTGNFNLYVGRRLNADGSVTATGVVFGAFDDLNRYAKVGQQIATNNGSLIWQDFVLMPVSDVVTGPLTFNNGYLDPAIRQTPLPILYNYTGTGQATFVFDTSNESITDGAYHDLSVIPDSRTYNGISTNAYYPGKADLRFYDANVI